MMMVLSMLKKSHKINVLLLKLVQEILSSYLFLGLLMYSFYYIFQSSELRPGDLVGVNKDTYILLEKLPD